MGVVLLGQLLLSTLAWGLTISPSPSTDGSYTVSWNAPATTLISTRLYEKAGSGAWSFNGTYTSTVTSRSFSGKSAGTYQYKTQQCIDIFNSPSCWDSEGPESVTVSTAPQPVPTASISWNPSTVDYGGSSTLSWSSTNATSCTLNGAPRATRGSWVGTNRTRNQTSRLYCTGPGGTSDTVSATLRVRPQAPQASPPDVPAKPTVVEGDERLTVSWTAPDDNGSPLTRYSMHYKATSASSWTTHRLSSVGAGTSTTITGLKNGTTYQLQVRAHNAVGASAFSATARGTPRDVPAVSAVPDVPAKPTVVEGDERLTVSWTAPDDNGSPLTRYGMHYKATSASSWTTHRLSSVGAGTSTTITGLKNGTTYQLQVRAHNAVGASAFSATARGTPRDVPAVSAVPDVPAKPTVVEGDERLTVSWTAPDDNGSPLTRYGMHYKATSASSWTTHRLSNAGAGTSTTITGLKNGTTYQLQVRAHNAVGASAFSATARGTPRDVPAVPARPAVVEGDERLTVSWTAPDDNGAAIDDYDVQYKRTGASSWRSHAFSGTGTSTTIRNLANGLEYEVQVQAHNAAGDSGFSRSAMARPALAPALSVLPSPSPDGAYTVSWGITRCFSVLFGGGQVCRVLQERVGESGSWTVVSGVATTATSHGVTGKTQGTYYYRLVIGTGPTAVVVAGPESVQVDRAPRATVSWNPATVDYGGTSTLRWSATDVTGCTLDGTDRGTSGSRVETNLTESQTSELSCTTAGNGTVTDSATLTVRAAPQITIVPSPSPNGSYTVSWSAPAVVSNQTRLYEQAGDDVWRLVGTYLSTVTSKPFRNKPGGTYQYKTQLCTWFSLGNLPTLSCSDLAGPKSVTVTGPTPATPATPTGPATSAGSHTVRWVAVTNATVYKLQERRDTESWTEYDEGTATSKALSGKDEGVWEYQVQACNGAVCSGWSGSLRISVAPPGTLTIEPSPSLDGDYTVSWSAPLAPFYQARLHEKVGSDIWRLVGTYYGSAVTSKAFRDKPTGTYQYKTQQCLGVVNITSCSDLAGPKSVEVDRAPMASISWNPSTVEYGGTSTLRWSATDVTGCTVDGTDEGTSGSRVETNRTESQTSELSCTTAGNGIVTDSDTLTVVPLPGITIEPSLSTDGNYTVSWNTPLCISRSGVQGLICRVLEERGGDDVTASWETVMDVSGTSRAFSDKPNGTYYYRLMLRTRPVAGPARVEVDRAPMASISWNPSTVEYGGTSTLRWSATEVTGCTVDGTNRGTSGSMVLANRTESQTSVLTCTTAGNGIVTDSATLTVRAAPQITIVPSPSPDGDYTVSWSAPVAPFYQTRLLEKVGSGAWGVVGTYLSTVTSKAFRNKPGGTYQYKTQQCLDVLNFTHCSDLAGPKSVTVTGPPMASISWNPSTVEYGGTSTLSWSATDVTGCTLDGTDEGTSGSRVETNLTESQTSELSCTTAGNGIVTDSDTLTVVPLPGITIEPSLSTDGNYTVSWNTPLCISRSGVQGLICRVLEERAGDDVTASWETVMDVSGTSRAFSDKPNGTYYYRLMLRTRPVAGPARVEVDRAPTASISWNPSTVEYGGTSTLSWSATEVTGCTVDGTDEETSGSRALTNLTESQTSELSCTTAGNGTVTDSATLTVRAAPQITIVPSPSPNGSYTVSWSAPAVVSNQTRLYEQAGDDVWRLVGTYLSTVTSKPFRNKPGGTYQYKTQLCTWFSLGNLPTLSCSDLAGPKSVTVTGPTPATPATPTGPATSAGSHTVRWVAVTNATVYKLQERRDTESWTEYDEGTATSKALSGKDEGVWEYQVQACNGAVCSGWSGSLRISVAPPGTLTIEPSPSLDGDYTVSWSAPLAPFYQARLHEKVGSDIWRLVGTYYGSAVTSKAFRDKPTGTYQYKTSTVFRRSEYYLLFGFGRSEECGSGPGADGKHQLESLDSGVRGHVDVALECDGRDGLYGGWDRRGDERQSGGDQPDGEPDERVVLHDGG